MELGFVLVSLAIMLPFGILVAIHNIKQKRQNQERLHRMLSRIGFEQNLQDSLHQQKRRFIKLFPVYTLVQNQLKQAGLIERAAIIKLLVAQSVLVFVSVYIWVTRVGNQDHQALLIASLLPFLPALFVWFKQRKRQAKIKTQFPEMLDTLVRALQSGFGIDGALNLVAHEFPDPLGKEIKEVNSQLQLGISMRDILREFQRRITLSEAQYFVVTLIIQRETGGQLVEILNDLSKMMRRRERFQGKLKSLTAESRFTALFIGGAPLVYLAYKFLFQPDSMTFFLTDPTGQKLFWGSLVLILTGTLLLRVMLKIRF